MPISSLSSEEGQLLWTPSQKSVEESHMEAFRKRVNAKYNLPLKSYPDLYKWSIDNICDFWSEVWNFCEIKHSKRFDKVLDDETKLIDHFPEWFPGAKLNFAENLLRFKDDHPAIIYTAETHTTPYVLTYNQLYQETAHVAAALREFGLKSGDVVAAYASNVPEVVIFMLASASIGAQFTTIPPEFGSEAVADRFGQTLPKILLASSVCYYNGRAHDQLEKVRGLVNKCSDSIKLTIILENRHDKTSAHDFSGEPLVLYQEFKKPFTSVQTLDFEQLPFNHPLYILYSSGTTGLPKCIVHSAGGTLIQHLKEHQLHGDLRRDDRVLYYTTIGWMMWHWLVSILSIGATIILYEGSPFKPTPDHLFLLTEELGITRFGTSAKYIQLLQESDYTCTRNLDTLKTIYSTGSPLSSSNYFYIYQHIKKDVQVSSITGGTDIVSLFGAPNPVLPVYSGEIQCPGLGMAISAYSDDGKIIVEDVAGDLVCLKPFPCMPVYFLGDCEVKRSKYRAAYFDQFANVWHHGDFIRFNQKSGGLVMLGRSDATLNPAGVRIGSADIYKIVGLFPQIVDSLVVGVQRANETDERIIMFVKIVDGKLENELVSKIVHEIKSRLSPRHVPAKILQTEDIPYTINGKKVEVAVKRILSGHSGGVYAQSLANPQSLEFYRAIAPTI
eukprot:TRINITY_DN13057_c0_g1_i1.p1 TRINITY_DN13057_c0_g1~~TRINITY_DN13057_c0_g1_i1.p1  ORF type:complete len:670 (+),score=96.52 TRINITY_DN13057_c0_g1_i1:51-2060(+)